MLISFAVTAKLICAFVFAYADCWFCHEAAQIQTIYLPTLLFYAFVIYQARAGNLAIEDMDGGTFSISNGGVFGSMFGTPIINPPQSAILGMHAIFDRPVAIKGKVCGLL